MRPSRKGRETALSVWSNAPNNGRNRIADIRVEEGTVDTVDRNPAPDLLTLFSRRNIVCTRFLRRRHRGIISRQRLLVYRPATHEDLVIGSNHRTVYGVGRRPRFYSSTPRHRAEARDGQGAPCPAVVHVGKVPLYCGRCCVLLKRRAQVAQAVDAGHVNIIDGSEIEDHGAEWRLG